MNEQTQPPKKLTWVDLAGPEESASGTTTTSSSSPLPDSPEGGSTNEDPGVLDYAADIGKGAWNGVVGAAQEANQFIWDVAGLPEQAFAGIDGIDPTIAKVAGALNPLGAVRQAQIALGWGTEDKAPGTEFTESLKLHTDTMAGQITQNVVSLGLGIVGAGKFLKAAKVLQGAGKAVGIARGALSGAIADATVMDPLEERLSNLVQSVPWLENPISEALAAKPDDNRWIGRLKNVAEGSLIGIPADLLISGVKALRGIKFRDEKLLSEGLAEVEAGLAKSGAGDNPFGFREVSAEEFISLRERTTRPEFLTPYSAEEMAGWNIRLVDDGVGFALKPDGDIVNVFNNSGRKGAGQEAVIEAIAQGGKKLDCYNGFLTDLYTKYGFVEVEPKRLKWDDQYAPKGWNYEQNGRPDVVYFEYPEGLSRDRADVRRRFEAARNGKPGGGGRDSGPGNSGNQPPSGGIREGVVQGEPGALDSGAGDSGRLLIGGDTPSVVKEAPGGTATGASSLRPEAPVLDVDKVMAHIKANTKTPEELLERGREVLNQHHLSITDELGLKLHEAVNTLAFERTKLAKGSKSLAEITGSAEEWKARGFYGSDVDNLLATANGKGATAEEATKAAYTMRSMYKAIQEELVPLTERLMTTGGSETDAARQQLLLLMQGKLYVGVKDFSTNAGRALVSLRETAKPFAEALRQGDPEAVTKAIKKLVQQGVMKSPDEWFTMLKKGNAAEIIGNPRAVRDLAQAITAKRGSDYFMEVFMNNILGGIRTHLTNTGGNGVKSFLTPAVRALGHIIPGKAFSPAEAAQELGTYVALKHQIGASARFALKAFKEDRSLLDAGGTAWTEAGQTTRAWSKENVRGRWVRKQLEGGKALQDVVGHVPDRVELLASVTDKIGNFINLPSRFLRMEDEFFKQLAYRSQMEADFTVEAVTRFGKENTGAITEYVAKQMESVFDAAGRGVNKEALEHARRMTWSQELRPGSVSRKVQDLTNAHPILKVVVPFVRTPTNLFMDSLEHIPVVRNLSADFRAAKKEGGRAYAEMQGKAAFGSLLMASTAMMAHEGLITGSGPSDSKHREALMRTGWRPNSVKVGDTYIGFNRMDPFATLITATANLVDAAPLMSTETLGELQATLLASTFRLIGDKSYMQSIGDLADFMEGDERARSRFIQRIATGFTTPNYLREARGVHDEIIRDVHTTWSRLKDGIPGFSTTLPARYDWLTGAPVVGGLSNLFGVSPVNEDVVSREVAALGGVFKTPPYKFNGVELTEAEHSRYCELIGTIELDGHTLHQALNKAIHSKDYDLERKRSSDDDIRAKYLNKIISAYRKAAGYRLQQENSRLPQDISDMEEHKANLPRLSYGGPKTGEALKTSNAPTNSQQRGVEELQRFAFQ